MKEDRLGYDPTWSYVEGVIADLASCEREREALKARVAEARWLIENVIFTYVLDLTTSPKWMKRRDAWLKEGEK